MFICEKCKKQCQYGHKIVAETKLHNHPYRSKVGKKKVFKWKKREQLVYGKWFYDWYDDPGGVGTQIKKEILVCPECK